jgi:DNA-binding beta-propeller fold protein YncE
MLRKILYLLLISVLLAACAAKAPIQKPPKLTWPLPPEKSRITFVDYIMGSIDVTGSRKQKFGRAIFGDEAEVRFEKPSFVATHKGTIYISDLGNIHKYDFNSGVFQLFGSGFLRVPTGVDVHSNGNLYVADSGLRQIVIFNPNGNRIGFLSVKDLISSMGGIALDEERDRILIANTRGHNIIVLSLKGEFLFEIGVRGPENGNFNYPYDVKVDEYGRIVVMDSGQFRIQIFDSEGEYLWKFGSVGNVPGKFARPKGLMLHPAGLIFVTDSAFGNFQIFDYFGRPYLSVGTTGSSPGMFMLPMGITSDEQDKIYVVDQLNRRVQVFQFFFSKKEDGEIPQMGANLIEVQKQRAGPAPLLK